MDAGTWTIVALTLAACPFVARRAFRAGRRIGSRKTMPWRPIFQLVDHRTHCLGHTPVRVRTELGSIVGLSSLAWGELLAMQRPVKASPRRVLAEPS